MRFLVAEKLGPHKFKTPEGYLICTDAILSRTGKQEYKRCELFGDTCEDPDKIVNVERTDDEVFSDKAMASFENKAVCIEHPDHDVNAENHNELAVGFVRDIHKGEDNGKPVMMGTLVITDKDAVEAVESGEYKELSCGYDCDIDDDDNPQQRNIRGNHVALCKHGRAGVARIVDSVKDNKSFAKGQKFKNANGAVVEIVESNDNNDYVHYTINGRHNIVKSESLKNMLDFNGYSLQDSIKDAPDLSGLYKNDDNDAIKVTRNGFSYDVRFGEDSIFNRGWSYSRSYDGTHLSQYLRQNKFKKVSKFDYLKDSVDDAGIKVWQVRQGYAIVVKRYWQQYGKNAFVDATESSIEAARYHRGSLERNDKMDFVIIDCNDGKYKIEDNEMKEIQSTKAAGTDKIIYVMQSDIDKNLYFYIGKTFSMKEGAWGCTKFEMGNTTPDELKSDLVRNGWHQVTSGPARVIDTSDVMLSGNYVYFEFAEVKGKSLKQEIERKYNSRYNKKIKVKRLDKHWVPGRKEVEIQVFADGMHENYDGFWAIVQATEEESKQLKDDWTEDSWSSVEEENYEKANKPVGAKDASVTDANVIASSEHTKIGKDWYGYFFVKHSKYGDFYVSFKIKGKRNEVQVDGTGWNFIKSKGYTSEQKAWIAQHKSDLERIYSMGTVADSKEQLFTVEYEQDGVTYIRKVRANSIVDAISKVKDVYNKFEHETDKEYLKSSINEMSRYISNWPFMTTREKRNISPEGLGALKQMLKFAQQRLAELK